MKIRIQTPWTGRLRLLPVIGCFVLLAGSAWAEQSPEDARLHFQRGRDFEAAGNLAGALAEYQMAMELRPTFRLHQYMGRVCRGMGRFRVALEHYQTFLREGEGSLDDTEAGEAREAISELMGNLASLQVLVDEGTTIFVNGENLGVSPMAEELHLDPGMHRVQLRLEGHQDYDERFELSPGEARTLQVTLQPLPETSDPVPDGPTDPTPADVAGGGVVETGNPDEGGRRSVSAAIFWAVAGVSAVMLVSGAVVGGVALSGRNEYDELNRSDRSVDEDGRMDQLEDRVPSMSLAADVLLFTGAAGVLAAIILVFFTDFGSGDSEPAARVVPTVTSSGVGLTLGGAF